MTDRPGSSLSQLMTKAIFLDIDGVLNCDRTPNPRKFPYIVDAGLLERFKALVARTDAQVVLSSTWRYDPIGLCAARHHGIPFDDVIPDLPDRPRRDAILFWLQANPHVDRYAVIDDEDDELDDLPLFQPSSATGLTEKVAVGIRSYLDGETNSVVRAGRLTRLWQNFLAVFRGHRG
jgi:HAD domain in Swiss Army Knife RNA repair proteins